LSTPGRGCADALDAVGAATGRGEATGERAGSTPITRMQAAALEHSPTPVMVPPVPTPARMRARAPRRVEDLERRRPTVRLGLARVLELLGMK